MPNGCNVQEKAAMTALKRFLPRAVLALAALLLNFGATTRSPPNMGAGEQSVWPTISLISIAHADDDGGDSDGDSGDSGDGSDSDSSGDSAESGDEATSEAEATDEAEETEEATETEEVEELETEEETEQDVDIESHDDGIEYVRGEVIGVGISAAERDDIVRLGGKIVDTDYFPALDITLTHVRTTTGRGAATLQAELNASDTGVYDLNHAYRPAEIAASRPATTADSDSNNPLALLSWAGRPGWCGTGVRMGVIDTAVNLSQLGLRAQQVHMRRFAPGLSKNAEHGTAIAGLLLGAPPNGPRGVLPAARLLVADVYRSDKHGQPLALTTDLISALNWLASQGVEVINMSLAGPPNRLLHEALEHLKRQGRVVVAAAGNRGPLAPPAYPAAYSGVVAVTAVNRQLGIFSHANRGFYIDLAAPGVGLSVAPGKKADGTSLAAIYVSAALADAVAAGAQARQAAERLLTDARDLGPTGWDPTFGYGLLLQPLSCPRKVPPK